MRLYKYRDLSKRDSEEFRRLEVILRDGAFWCARPDTLNDPEEFAWFCDYTASDATVGLLGTLISQSQGRTLDHSFQRAAAAISNGRLAEIAAPTIENIIQKCRDEIGLACFATSAESPILWERYGGRGAGVCVEVDVPDDLLGSQLHQVEYPDNKVIHIDQLMRAALDTRSSREVFTLSLLCKPRCWAAEAEVRFISKLQNVLVSIDRSRIAGIWFGSRLDSNSRLVVEQTIESLPYDLPTHMYVA